MNCPSCGHLNPADSAFCESCGARMVVVCPNCGVENRAGARFCPRREQKIARAGGQGARRPRKGRGSLVERAGRHAQAARRVRRRLGCPARDRAHARRRGAGRTRDARRSRGAAPLAGPRSSGDPRARRGERRAPRLRRATGPRRSAPRRHDEPRLTSEARRRRLETARRRDRGRPGASCHSAPEEILPGPSPGLGQRAAVGALTSAGSRVPREERMSRPVAVGAGVSPACAREGLPPLERAGGVVNREALRQRL